MNENSFNTNQFDEVTEFPSHLTFVEGLLDRYDLDAETMKRMRAEIDKLRRKHDDKLLNLSVLGEFSTGKSTFINALLRRDGFLQASSLQGTTTTATIIENSDKYMLICKDKEGVSTEEEFPDCETLEARVAEICSDKNKASSLYSVTIKLPAPLLEKRGFRIIDTPGTNSSEHWCDDVTIRTISELSDLSIIIIDATKALPQQFCEFIIANLQSILNQCVFVVTKVNMIRKKELDGVMQYIKEKAEKEFEIKNPLILPYSSTDVLDNVDDLNSDELPELVVESLKSERMIMDHMSSQKSIVQTLNLIDLADNIYDTIQAYMKTANERHEKALALARRRENIGNEFNDFIHRQDNELNDEINGRMSKWLAWFEEIIDIRFNSLRSNIVARVAQFQDLDSLCRIFETELQATLSQRIRETLVEINRKDKEFAADCEWICSKFVDNFKETFRDVEIFDENEELKSEYTPSNDFICFPILSPIIMYAYQLTGFKELMGNFFPKPTKADAVVRCQDNIKRAVSMYINDAIKMCQNECQNYVQREIQYISVYNHRFVEKYRKEVSENIGNTRDRIEEQMRCIQEDTAQLNIRKGKLDMVSKMLTIMARKETI